MEREKRENERVSEKESERERKRERGRSLKSVPDLKFPCEEPDTNFPVLELGLNKRQSSENHFGFIQSKLPSTAFYYG